MTSQCSYTRCDTSMCTFIATYLLTACSRVLLEKLTGLQVVKKFPAFYGTRRFITAFTSSRHLYQSWAGLIQSIAPNPTSRGSNLMLSSHLRLIQNNTIHYVSETNCFLLQVKPLRLKKEAVCF